MAQTNGPRRRRESGDGRHMPPMTQTASRRTDEAHSRIRSHFLRSSLRWLSQEFRLHRVSAKARLIDLPVFPQSCV